MSQILNRNVLVLNKHWMAIHVCSVRRALSLVYQDLASVVTEDYEVFDFDTWKDLSRFADTGVVYTPQYPLLAPEVILLRRCNKLPSITSNSTGATFISAIISPANIAARSFRAMS